MRIHVILILSLVFPFLSYGQKPTLVIPLGHTETITAVDFSYDGKYVFSAGLDQQVKIWKRSSELVRTINDFEKPVIQLVVSPTAYYFVAVTENKLVLYDFEGNIHFEMAKGKSPRFSPDGNYLLFKVGIYTSGVYPTWERDDNYVLNLQKLIPERISVNTSEVQFSQTGNYGYYWDGSHLLSFDFETHWADTLYNGQLTTAFYEEIPANAYYSNNKANNPFPFFWVKESEDRLILFGKNNLILTLALDEPSREYVETRSKNLTNTTIETSHYVNPNSYVVIHANQGDFVVSANAGKCEILTIKEGRLIDSSAVTIDVSERVFPISLSNDDKYLVLASTTEDTIYIYDILEEKLLSKQEVVNTYPPSLGYTASKGFSLTADGLLMGHNHGDLELFDFSGDLLQSFTTVNVNFINSVEIGEKVDGQINSFYLFTTNEDESGTNSGLEVDPETETETDMLYKLTPENNQLEAYTDMEKISAYTDILSNTTFSEEARKKYPPFAAAEKEQQYAIPISPSEFRSLTPTAIEEPTTMEKEQKVISSLIFDDSNELTLSISDNGELKVNEENRHSIPFIDVNFKFKDVMLSDDDQLMVIEDAYSCTCENVKLTIWDMNCVWEARTQLNEKLVALNSDTSLLSNPYFTSRQYLYSLTQVDCEGSEYKIAPCSKLLNSSSTRSEILAANKGKLLILNTENGRIRELIGHRIDILGASYFNEEKYIVSWSSDHTIKFWSADTGENLLTYIILGQEDWVTTSPSGLFDASPGAMRKLYYNVGLELVDIEQLKERYYEPGLMAKTLGYARESIRSVDGLNHLELYPEVNANLARDTLSIHLKSRNGGIGKVSIFVNGKEIIEDANPGGANGQRDSSFQLPIRPFYKYLWSHPDSSNYISIRAYNESGWLKSKPISFQIKGSNSKGLQLGEGLSNWQATERPKFYAIIIGTQDYRGEDLDLAYADKDANAMAKAIQQTASNLFVDKNKGDTIDIRCLTTSPVDSLELAKKGIQWSWSSKENIQQVFTDITSEAKAEDVILVYFSGHGATYGNADAAAFYYLTKDIANANISDQGIRDNYTVSSHEITAWLNKIPALKQVLIIDACSSGKVIEVLNGSTKSLNSDQIRAIDRMKDRTGMYVISGSASDKVSYEAGQYGQSLLTYALLKGMIGAATTEVEQSKFIDVMTLFQYARNEVPELANSINGIQTPMLGFPTNAASFDIGILDQSLDIELSTLKPVVIRSMMMNKESLIDDKGLTSKLELGLEEESAQGYQANYIYVPTNSYPGAYSLRGLYEINKDGEIVLTARLIQDDTLVTTIDVPRSTNEEHIIKYLKRALRKFLQN